MTDTHSPITGDDPTTTIALVEQADLLRPMALRVAATLRLADHIGEAGATLDDLAEATATNAPSLRRLLDYLVAQGWFTARDGHYYVAPAGRPLRGDAQFSVAQALDVRSAVGRSQVALVGMLHTIKTGAPCHETIFGASYWDDLNGSPQFLETMRQEGNRTLTYGGEEILHGFDWSSANTVIDLGGNNGLVLLTLLETHPHLSGATMDLANFTSIASEEIAAAGLEDRAEAIEGSFFEELPKGYDVYLLSGIFNDWQDADVVRILTRVAEAVTDETRIRVAEINLRYELMTPEVETMELYMSTVVPAPVRTHQDIRKLAAEAGLEVVSVREENPFRTLFELRRRQV